VLLEVEPELSTELDNMSLRGSVRFTPSISGCFFTGDGGADEKLTLVMPVDVIVPLFVAQ